MKIGWLRPGWFKGGEVESSELRRAFARFRPALRGQRIRVLQALGLALAVTGLELIKPWPITWIIDDLIAAEAVPISTIGLYAAVAFVIPSLIGLANERQQLIVAKVSRKAVVRIRGDVFEHVQRLELAEHQRRYSGDLLVRLMGDVNMIRDLLFPSWLNLVSRGSVIIGGAVVFALVEWRLFLVALIPLPLLWVSVERGSAAVKTAAGKQRRKEGMIAAEAAEAIRNVGIIKAFSAEERTAGDFRARARSAERATMAAARQTARMMRRSEVLTGAGIGLLLVVGATRVQAGLLSPGQLVLVISYARMLYKPLRKLTGEGARLGKATACAVRVMELLDQPTEDASAGDVTVRLTGDIEFGDIDHAYGDGRPTLVNFSYAITEGSLVAVTGENGAGKSTLLSLLLRLYRPGRGTITIGGVDIETLQLGSYRQQIAYVPQELALFGGTIRDNILFGRPEADDEAVLSAARSALFMPVLDRLPDGLDTVLAEDGSSLSGGEARRLMLARAAIRDASILLLDEPLAGLDPEARVIVASAITTIAAGRTTLVVHHGDLDEIQPDQQIEMAGRSEPPPLKAVG